MDKKKKDDILDEEQFDHEMARHDENDIRRPKRLRLKEKRSKKTNSLLKLGRVLKCYTNNLFNVKIGSELITCPLSGRFKNVELASRAFVVVGDKVQVDMSREHPIIEEVNERSNTLNRFVMRGNCEVEVPIAANIDQVIITASCGEPKINLNLVDRYLCSATLNDIESIICINKIDLLEDISQLEEKCSYYEDIGIKVVLVSAKSGKGIEKLKELLRDRDTLFSGPSGAGKSTLINRLEPGLNLRTGEVSEITSKGKHTTSYSELIPWSFGGYLIDTPGIKTFGLPISSKQDIPRMFPGFERWAPMCRFNDCIHIAEEGCRVKEALESGELDEERYQSYLNIYDSL
jgi:ribosome biogenesis GTPase / thiamine phosphate phosphatase